MTTKPPSRLAASAADDPESEQITKEHNDEDASHITVDPSEDVTVEATEDVTSEATHTPPPSLRPGTVGVHAGQRAPTLLGVPIQSLPLPGVTSSSFAEGETRTIDYNDEITVLAHPAPADPLAALDEALDDRPSVTDDDEEETKVEPAEAAMKAAESSDDVTTALSAQANLEREKALRRSAPASSPSDDLEFADPDADDEEEEESLDDELDDDDEVISAGGAIEEEEDDLDDGQGDGVATATFMKPADTTGLSGLLNPRRPPTGGRDGFGSRLPTPYPPPQTTIPAPSTSPFASRLGPVPTGSPYSGRSTTGAMTAIQVPPPSGKATTESEPGFFTKRVPVPGYGLIALVIGAMLAGAGFRGLFGGKSSSAPTVLVAKPTSPPPTAPVVVPVQTGTDPTANPATNPSGNPPPAGTEPPGPSVQAIGSPTENPNPDNPEAGLWRPAKKPAAQRVHKPTDATEEAMLKPKPAVAKEPKPVVAKEPKPVVAKEPKPAAQQVAAVKPAAPAKPAKKPAKAWVDPFAN